MFFQFFSGDDGGGLCHKLLGFAIERKRSRMSIFIQVGIHDNFEVLLKVGNGCCRQITYAAYIKLVGRFYILQSEETVLVRECDAACFRYVDHRTCDRFTLCIYDPSFQDFSILRPSIAQHENCGYGEQDSFESCLYVI